MGNSNTFLIKHRSSGKYFHPETGMSAPSNGTGILLHEGMHSNMHWTFEKDHDHWGYIKHVNSGLVIHPATGTSPPTNYTGLLLHSGRHYGALFALDAVNHHVMHKLGKFAHPQGGGLFPENNTPVELHEGIHDGMKFEFVSPSDPKIPVFVYGTPKVVGKWKIINMVLDPKAEHTQDLEVRVGLSKTEGSSSSIQSTLEMSIGAEIKVFTASLSASLQAMTEKSSSATWSKETTQKRTIKVSPGKSVVTWQYVYDIELDKDKGEFRSNLLADTESEAVEPRELNQVYKV